MDSVSRFRRGPLNPYKAAHQWLKKEDSSALDAARKSAAAIAAATGNGQKKWTVLVYVDGNNTLYGPAYEAMKALEKVGSDANVNIIVQLGANPGDKPKGGFSEILLDKAMAGKKLENVGRYKVIKDTSDSDVITSPVVQDMGKADMGDPNTVSDFLKWGIKSYPADNYAVVLFDHGAGFAGVLSDENTDSLVNMAGLKKVMADAASAAGQKIGVVDLDACLMAQDAVAHAVQDSSKFMVASEETERGMAQPLATVIKDLQEGSKTAPMAPEDLAKLFVYEAYSQPSGDLLTSTLSAVNLEKMPAVSDAADKFAQAVISALAIMQVFADAIAQSEYYCKGEPYKLYNDMHDLGDFARRVNNDPRIRDANVKTTSGALLAAVKDAVVAREHSGAPYAQSSGMSSYLPLNFGYDPKPRTDSVNFAENQDFNTTLYAQDTHWGQMLTALANDSTWHDLLKHTGISKDGIDNLDHTLHTAGSLTSSVATTSLSVGNLVGKYQALEVVLNGAALAPGLMNVAGALGGAYEMAQGIRGLHDAFSNEAPQGIADLLFDRRAKKVNASLKIAAGAALTAANVGLLAGLPAPYVIAAGALALAIPAAKMLYDGVHIAQRVKEQVDESQNPPQPANIPVADKLQDVANHNNELARV